MSKPSMAAGGIAAGLISDPPASAPAGQTFDNPASPPLLDVRSARVEFGPLLAVHDVSFELRSGHLLGLIGPNGAGKTTLLRVLAGLQQTTAGTVHVMGRQLDPGDRSLLSHIGFTPDTPAFYPQLTVRDYLRFIARGYLLSGSEVDERIDFWLEKVWLAEKAGQKVRSLSRGMRQRLGIARTLLPNPAVVLLDEPAGGLDPAGRVQFRQLLCDLRDQGKTLVVSSHILSDMSDYCTHIGIMAGGKMLRLGTVASIAAHADAGQSGDESAVSRCRYTITLAQPAPRLDSLLDGIAGVAAVQAERDRAVFEYAAGRDAAAALLADLVARGLPIASFAPNPAGLEEAYLRSGIAQVD